jgi:putative hemolysin
VGNKPGSAKQETIVVNIYEAGPFEGRLLQWPVLAVTGALEVRLAETEHEIEQAQRLRYAVFYEEMDAIPSPAMRESRRDFDKYDDVCDHLLVVDRDSHD